MNRLAWFLLGFFVVFGLVFACESRGDDYFGFGGGVHNGHSYSSKDKIDPPGYTGMGVRTFYEGDRNHDQRVDFTYLGRLDFIGFGKRDNENGKANWEYMVGPSLEGRSYLRVIGDASLYLGLGAGGSIATDGLTPFATVSYGLEKRINSRWCAEIGGTHFVTTERRHDLYTVGLKYAF